MASYVNDITDFKCPTRYPTKTELEIMKQKYMNLNNRNRGLIVRYAWTF